MFKCVRGVIGGNRNPSVLVLKSCFNNGVCLSLCAMSDAESTGRITGKY